MKALLHEGLGLAQQMAALPFKAIRQALNETMPQERALNGVLKETLELGEGLARLPFKVAGAVLDEFSERASLQQRVADLESRLAQPKDSSGQK